MFKGKIYTITDVHDLHTWMLFHLTNNKLFVTASEIEMVILHIYLLVHYIPYVNY